MNHPPLSPLQPAQDYPDHPVRPPRASSWLWVALAIAVVIIVVLAAVVISKSKGDDAGSNSSAAPQPSVIQQAPQPNGAPLTPNGVAGQPMNCEGFTAAVDPNSQPGWHATIDRHGLAYAVPPDWTVAACGVRMGWAQPCQEGQCVIRQIGAASSIANPTCPKQNLAMAGVTGSNNPDIGAALEEETQTVSSIYTRGGQLPKVEFTPVREFFIGTHPAVQMVATVSGMATDACNGSTALHSIVVTTVPNVDGSVVFLVSLRQGANATPKPDVIDKIVATLRSPA
ncbi:MAG: hypothetical protein ABW001_12705 [Mycobacterium sp.]